MQNALKDSKTKIYSVAILSDLGAVILIAITNHRTPRKFWKKNRKVIMPIGVHLKVNGKLV